MLDDIMLLSGGRTVYFGHRLACLPALSAQGYKCPPETNPAEFVLDVISVDASSPKRERASSARVRVRFPPSAPPPHENKHTTAD